MALGSGGKGGNSGRNGQDLLSNTIADLTAETRPIRQELSSQFQEALTTGGIGARIPIITAMQEQSKAATANALRGTGEQLSAQGLARTPFGASILAGVRQQGDLATSLIPSSVAQSFIGGAPSFAMAPVGAMIGGAGTLANVQANRDIAKGQQQIDYYKMIMQGASSLGGVLAACWIARRIYGERSCDALMARYFIFYRWRGPVAHVVRRLYRANGEFVSRRRWAILLKPLFDVAVRKALS